MKILIILFLSLVGLSSFAQSPECEIKRVETPVIFLKPPVHEAWGTQSIQLPNCKVLSLGFARWEKQTLIYQVTDEGGEDETFGKVRRLIYTEQSNDPRGTFLNSHFVVPDGIMFYGWLRQSSGVALLPTELLFIKFKFDGTLDDSVFNGKGTTNFSTNSPSGPYTFMNQFRVSSHAVNGNHLDLSLVCNRYEQGTFCSDYGPYSRTIQLGWNSQNSLKI